MPAANARAWRPKTPGRVFMTWLSITALVAVLLATLQATSGHFWTPRWLHPSLAPSLAPGLRACSTPNQQVIYHASTSNGLNQRLRDSYVPYRGCWYGDASQSLPANNCCPTYRPAGAQPDTPPGTRESPPPCFVPVVSSADAEVKSGHAHLSSMIQNGAGITCAHVSL